MKLIKCPRCDLNYMREGEKYCKICLREVKGESVAEEVELCSICNEAPALPGKDVCFFCLKEMDERKDTDSENEEIGTMDHVDDPDLEEIDNDMDGMLPELDEVIDDEQAMSKMEEQLSLESVQEDEEKEENEEEEEEF